MRSKKAVVNTLVSIALEIITAISAFVLPRLILLHFGSDYNGIIVSVTQFLSGVVLLKSGIGAVTRVALFKPLAVNDVAGISSVLKATERFMRKVAKIFAVALLVFAALYPFLIKEDFGWLFTFSLIVIIGMSSFSQYYFAFSYQMILQADQRQYISELINIFGVIVNTIIAVALIKLNFSILVVKLGSAVIFVIQPILLSVYVRKKYKISKDVEPNNKAIGQRWDAFGHQIARYININTDVIVLTLFTSLKEVSVYAIYCMIVHAIRKIINALAAGIVAAFGNMMANKEEATLYRCFNLFEIMIWFVSTIILGCTVILIVPFVQIYTNGITDVSYYRPLFAVLLVVVEFLFSIQIPYQTIIYAAGHFKETRNGAFVEAGINIVVSLAFVQFWGLLGVCVGTICAIAFRTAQLFVYVNKHIIIRKITTYIKLFSCILSLIIVFAVAYVFLPTELINDYGIWVNFAAGLFLSAVLIGFAVFLLCYKDEAKEIKSLIIKLFSKEKKH